jgi:hypothetical protein
MIKDGTEVIGKRQTPQRHLLEMNGSPVDFAVLLIASIIGYENAVIQPP